MPKKLFKKGEINNPRGRPGDDPILKKIKVMTSDELVGIANLIVKGKVSELRAIAQNPDATTINVMVAAVAVKIIAKGDMHALDILLNRLVGKVKERIEHSGELKSGPVLILPEKEIHQLPPSQNLIEKEV